MKNPEIQEMLTNKTLTNPTNDPTIRAWEELNFKLLQEQDIKTKSQPTTQVVKKPSLATSLKKTYRKTIVNIKYLFHGNPPTPFKRRMQFLAGIKPQNVARLTVDENVVVEFDTLPSPLQVLKFRLCGFRYELLKTLDEKKLT